jgi:lipopolysaccharide/colanic/teichoic acid biosynthesis glycosyltransferase
MYEYEIKNEKEISISGNKFFWFTKRVFDIVVSIFLIPIFVIITMALFFLRFFSNKDPVFYKQKRMGKYGKPFYLIKFRTMITAEKIERNYFEPLEVHRITTLGQLMRKMRIDELPQILNVLKGEMSLIGPRPDYYIHALEYIKNVKGYKERHIIRPGITGLSQIRLGYIEGLEATAKKASVDNYYIQNVNYIIELKIIGNTIITIIRCMGK